MSRGGAAGCIVAVAMVPVGIILRGFVLCQLWLWFLVPLGVSNIGIPHALGLTTLVGLFGMQNSNSLKKDEDVPAVLWMVAVSVGPPLFCLFFGWIFHALM